MKNILRSIKGKDFKCWFDNLSDEDKQKYHDAFKLLHKEFKKIKTH